jgi:Transposase DDE domain
MMVVEVFQHSPIATWYTQDSQAHDQSWMQQLLEKLPVGGLLIFDLGFFNFVWFDALTDAHKFFVTRLRQKTAYQTRRCLSQGTRYRDEIIQMGQYRSNPCQHEVRLVSVLWGTTWYRYLTNVLDPEQLSARQVCELYRRRWRVEEAFLLAKRLLGLAYLWVGGTNGVEIQVYATWIFYALLNDLSAEVAMELSQPKERISVEMVFRGLYHFSQALLRGEKVDVVTYLVEHHRVLGLIKQERKRHREQARLSQEVWMSTA